MLISIKRLFVIVNAVFNFYVIKKIPSFFRMIIVKSIINLHRQIKTSTEVDAFYSRKFRWGDLPTSPNYWVTAACSVLRNFLLLLYVFLFSYIHYNIYLFILPLVPISFTFLTIVYYRTMVNFQ